MSDNVNWPSRGGGSGRGLGEGGGVASVFNLQSPFCSDLRGADKKRLPG